VATTSLVSECSVNNAFNIGVASGSLGKITLRDEVPCSPDSSRSSSSNNTNPLPLQRLTQGQQ